LRASDPVKAVQRINASLHGLDPSLVKEEEVAAESAPEPEPTTDAEPGSGEEPREI